MTLPTALVGLLGCIAVVATPFVLVALTPPTVTRAGFEALRPGMDPAAAEAAIGHAAREQSLEATGAGRTQRLVWENPDGSAVTAEFENGRLVSKRAERLR